MKDFEEARPAKRDWKRECKELETLVAQQAAVIEQMRHIIRRYRDDTPLGYQPHMLAHSADEILALQPCPEVLNRVRADAVREFVKPYSDSHTYIGIAVKKEAELVAQRMEQGRCDD